MEIIIGKTSGFFGGVIKSVKEAENILEKYDYIYCLGELVHNKQVVESLEEKGLKVIDSLDDIDSNSKVIVRAHGVSKDIYEDANKRSIKLIDLTCPKVLLVHQEAEKLVNDGYYIVLLGKNTHPEVIGTISYCGVNSMVVESENDLDELFSNIRNSNCKKIAILAQTTYSVDKFNEIVQKVAREFDSSYDVLIKNTICSATELRQQETKEIASKVDAMIIIGGKNSSNTKKLYDIASKLCNNTFIIETFSDLDYDFSLFEKIGVMAGASTPKDSIDDVVNYLKKCENK